MLGVKPRLDGGKFDHCLAVLLAAVLGREKVSVCCSPIESLDLCWPGGGCNEFRWLNLPGVGSVPTTSLPASLLASMSVMRLLTMLFPSFSSSTSARESGRP